MATTLGNRVLIKGDPTYEENVANAGLSPGHLIELLSTGKVQKHSTAAGRAEKRVALEQAWVGPNIFTASAGSLNINTAYATGDLVPNAIFKSGEMANVYLKSGTSYHVGDKLISAGDGTLEIFSSVSSTDVPGDEVAIVEDSAIDLTVSGAVATLHPVRFL